MSQIELPRCFAVLNDDQLTRLYSHMKDGSPHEILFTCIDILSFFKDEKQTVVEIEPLTEIIQVNEKFYTAEKISLKFIHGDKWSRECFDIYIDEEEFSINLYPDDSHIDWKIWMKFLEKINDYGIEFARIGGEETIRCAVETNNYKVLKYLMSNVYAAPISDYSPELMQQMLELIQEEWANELNIY